MIAYRRRSYNTEDFKEEEYLSVPLKLLNFESVDGIDCLPDLGVFMIYGYDKTTDDTKLILLNGNPIDGNYIIKDITFPDLAKTSIRINQFGGSDAQLSITYHKSTTDDTLLGIRILLLNGPEIRINSKQDSKLPKNKERANQELKSKEVKFYLNVISGVTKKSLEGSIKLIKPDTSLKVHHLESKI